MMTWRERIVEQTENYFLWDREVVLLEPHKVHIYQGHRCAPSRWLLALKVLSVATVVFPLLMLGLRAYLRAHYPLERVNLRQELEQGITLPEAAETPLKKAVAKIFQRKLRGTEGTFTLPEAPHLIFKHPGPDIIHIQDGKRLAPDEIVEFRMRNRVRALEIVRVYRLTQLRVPRAKIIEVPYKDHQIKVIAEERFSSQAAYGSEADRMRQTLRELVVFIAKTGLTRASPQTLPILDSDAPGERQVLLTYLDELWNAQEGLLGLLQSIGAEDHFEMIVKEAANQGITLPQDQLEKAFVKSQLRLFGHFKIKLESLDICLDKIHLFKGNGELFTLKQMAEQVILQINRTLEGRGNPGWIALKTDTGPLSRFSNDAVRHLWLKGLLEAFQRKGYISELKYDYWFFIKLT